MLSLQNLSKKSINNIQSVFFSHNFGKKIFTDLKKYVGPTSSLLVAVSGGVDSMVLAVLIYSFFSIEAYDLNNLTFVHLHHGVRKESDEEMLFVERFFNGEGKMQNAELVIKMNDGVNTELSEAGLRIWRYAQFAEICREKKIDFLLTGHHLNDRVESTFLHLLRGASLQGFLSMNYCDNHHLLGDTKLLRPLLSLTKRQIQFLANQLEIPFVVDQSNFDEKVSKRNLLRNKILPELFALGNGEDKFLESMEYVYEDIEECCELHTEEGSKAALDLVKIEIVPEWGAEFGYMLEKQKKVLRIKDFLGLMKQLGIAQNVTKKNLSDIVDFLNTKTSGYKCLNGVNFFVSHGKIYIIKSEKEFWKKTNNTENISTKPSYCDGGNRRYPKQGDIFHGKTWKQFCIRQKIPIFWRDWVLVCAKDEKILQYFWEGKILG